MSTPSDDKTADWYHRWADPLMAAIIVATATTFAALRFVDYYSNPDLLWRDFYHDRNSHFSLGVDLAIALRSFDPVWFFSELEKSMVWPPFHGLVLSVVLLFAGIDHRFAIVPSLIGWVMTVVFVWLITRRLFRERMPGVFAAAVAVILTAASPAFRLLTSDAMLEGLGAGLSALALWAYLRAVEEPNLKLYWRVLALTLTALFFEKYNYWGLTTAAVAAALIFGNVQHAAIYIGAIIEKARIADVASRAWRDPLLVAFLIVVTIFGVLRWADLSPISFYGVTIRLNGRQENVLTAAYVLLFARLFLVWRRHRGEIGTALGLGGRTIFYWTVAPIAISFLLPKRLSSFFWYVGPLNGTAHFDFVGGAVSYWRDFAQGFHVATWMAVLSVGLGLLGATQLRKLRPGARVVFLFVLISCIAVIAHPQHQGRFLASWAFAVWICAGTGAGVILAWIFTRKALVLQMLVAGAATAGLAAAAVWEKPSPVIYAVAIYPTSGPSDLDLIRPYLHELDGARDISIATTFGASRFFRWAIHEHCKCKATVVDLFIDSLSSRALVQATMADRIANSTSDVFVIIDAPGSRYSLPGLGWVYEKMVGVVDAMQNQSRYVRVADYPIPSEGAQASIWRRRNDGQ
jgi:Dolichyl-phosphate-mannose-protein mannosyltransferase